MKLIFNLLIFAWLAVLSSSGQAQSVGIRFRSPTLCLTNASIRLHDVTTLSGGDAAILRQLSNLDLEEFGSDQASIEISAEMVRYRILLAGISDSKFHIEPATSTTVFHWRPEKINRLIEQALVGQFVDAYRIPENELELTLISELDAALVRAGLELNSLNVVARLPMELPIGQRTIPITVSDMDGKSLNLNSVCRITVFRNLAMVSSTVAKGQALNDTNVQQVRRRIDSPSIGLVSYNEVIGKIAQVNLQANSIVNQQAIRAPVAPPTQIIHSGIKRNEVVTIIVQQGNLSVMLKNARANQNGQIGETLAFTNPLTNKVVYAKLLDPNTAIIHR